MRLRRTALPDFFVTVKPTRGAPPSPLSSTSSAKSRPRRVSPRRTARNSALLRSLRGGLPVTGKAAVFLGGEPLAAAVAASGDHATTTLGGHAGTKAVPTLADEFGRLVGALHLFKYRGVRPFFILSLDEQERSPACSRAKRIAPDQGPERERAYMEKVPRSQLRALLEARPASPSPDIRLAGRNAGPKNRKLANAWRTPIFVATQQPRSWKPGQALSPAGQGIAVEGACI